MKIQFPGVSQSDLDYALLCLADCRHEEAAESGFPYPYFAPGGGYGAQWWQLDSALALSGYKWVDWRFAETALLNFVEAQKEDGRICLWGGDILPERVAGDEIPLQREGVSSIPKLFDVACGILEGSTDGKLMQRVCTMLVRYLDWWYAARFDARTGLLSSVFEETVVPYLGRAGEYAGVDTNVEVYVGLTRTAQLARRLGRDGEAALLEGRAEALKRAINAYLWDEERGAYYAYDLRAGRRRDCLMASAFCPLRLGIAPEENRARLLRLLLDPTAFNWETRPLTSVSMRDPAFCTTTGVYKGNASWSGNVWSLINEMVVRGLLDCGEDTLAAELAWKTVRIFNHNCAEFANPFDGRGHGVEKYGWTASQYLELLVEVIFGIRYDVRRNEVTVSPKLCGALSGERLSLEDVRLPNGQTLDVCIDAGRTSLRLRA